MAKQQKPKRANDVESLLTDLLITQLAASGVQQKTIRAIVGCDVNRVSRITKHVKTARKQADARAT
jgi:hypothetical protein